ncbi:coiled-coil domain-containing protein 27 isoform X2 [Ambystoma mexicanum]|uniref:coiled-coil domain-containing protein 27 isoform X2 n=1 Tax=Ambystoma mexicanum TaxID=8296 RepID=UPI0037E76C35
MDRAETVANFSDEMKDQNGLKMNGCLDPSFSASRRPKTAVWKIPSNDTRRENFSKSAPGPSSDQLLFTPRLSSTSSFRTSQLSSASDLQHSFSSCPACSRLSKMLLSPAQFESSSAATSDIHINVNRWNNSCYGYANNLESKAPSNMPSSSNFDSAEPGSKVGKLPHILQDMPKFPSFVDGRPVPAASIQNIKSGVLSEQMSGELRPPWFISVLNEKERFLQRLGEEVTRLSKVEEENMKKDHVISVLQQEVQRLKGHVYHLMNEAARRDREDALFYPGEEERREPASVVDVFRQKSTPQDLRELGGDLSLRRGQDLDGEAELQLEGDSEAVEEQPDSIFQSSEENLETQSPTSRASSAGSGDTGSGMNGKGTQTEKDEVLVELGNLQIENQELAIELDKLKRDYELCTGFSSSLQRQFASLESQLRKTESDLSKLQKEFKERGMQLQAMSAKFSNLRDERKHEEMLAAMEKENYSLRQSVTELTSELELRNSIIGGQKSDIQKVQTEEASSRDQLKKALNDNDEAQSKIDALELSESQLKVALEATNSKFERFRGKILQATYSTAGAKPPQVELSDTEILEAMQKIITDRAEFHQQLIQKGVKMHPLALEEVPPPVTFVSSKMSTTKRKSTSQ